eukprot:10452397-Alexandrium_andersonii.AAC.1
MGPLRARLPASYTRAGGWAGCSAVPGRGKPGGTAELVLAHEEVAEEGRRQARGVTGAAALPV